MLYILRVLWMLKMLWMLRMLSTFRRLFKGVILELLSILRMLYILGMGGLQRGCSISISIFNEIALTKTQ